jgi:hypothetical protein
MGPMGPIRRMGLMGPASHLSLLTFHLAPVSFTQCTPFITGGAV